MRKVCEICKGAGIIGEWKGNSFRWRMCETCKGEGIIEVEEK